MVAAIAVDAVVVNSGNNRCVGGGNVASMVMYK